MSLFILSLALKTTLLYININQILLYIYMDILIMWAKVFAQLIDLQLCYAQKSFQQFAEGCAVKSPVPGQIMLICQR